MRVLLASKDVLSLLYFLSLVVTHSILLYSIIYFPLLTVLHLQLFHSFYYFYFYINLLLLIKAPSLAYGVLCG